MRVHKHRKPRVRIIITDNATQKKTVTKSASPSGQHFRDPYTGSIYPKRGVIMETPQVLPKSDLPDPRRVNKDNFEAKRNEKLDTFYSDRTKDDQ